VKRGVAWCGTEWVDFGASEHPFTHVRARGEGLNVCKILGFAANAFLLLTNASLKFP
jgi:hypothetical protein